MSGSAYWSWYLERYADHEYPDTMTYTIEKNGTRLSRCAFMPWGAGYRPVLFGRGWQFVGHVGLATAAPRRFRNQCAVSAIAPKQGHKGANTP